ncbi:hypothetical protein [Pontivivens ytuae]|nr:hypothetical protein [Pontivivens ytuae]
MRGDDETNAAARDWLERWLADVARLMRDGPAPRPAERDPQQ